MKRHHVFKNVKAFALSISAQRPERIIDMGIKLSTTLVRLLEERRLTLKDLAQITGLKPSTLSGWKNGVSPRNLSEVRLCARALGVSMEKLLFNEESSEVHIEHLATENVFDGFLKVRIERIIPKKNK